MQAIKLLEHVEFGDSADNGHAQALFADAGTRALRFSLKDGQSIQTHHAHSPVVVVVVDGVGRFTGADGEHLQAGANTMLVFSAGEEIMVEHTEGNLNFSASSTAPQVLTRSMPPLARTDRRRAPHA